MKYLYIIYQYLIALPIFAVITILTAIITIIFQHWRNAEWLHKIQQMWSRSFYWLLFMNVKVEGIENIEKGKSYVIVSNHQSMSDVFAIYGWLPVCFKWIMKKELRKIPFVGTACAAAGHIYIDRNNRRGSVISIKQAENITHDGVCVVIFPEGTRTTNGEVGRFKRGAFAIANDLKVPIVPISLTGCFELMPKGRFYATHTKVTMRIGKPIEAIANNDEEQLQLIEQVRNAVIEGMDKKK